MGKRPPKVSAETMPPPWDCSALEQAGKRGGLPEQQGKPPPTPPSSVQQKPTATGPSATERLITDSKSTLWRARRQLLPLGAMGATYLGGAIAAGLNGPISLLPIAIFLGAGYAAVLRLNRKARRALRRYAITACAASTGWVTMAAFTGTGGVMPEVLWLGGSALAVPWWRRHRTRLSDLPPKPKRSPMAMVDVGPSEDERLFAERIAKAGQALPKAKLTRPEPITGGRRGVITLDPGQQDTSTAIAAAPRIASAYELPLTQVIVEATPDGKANRAQLTLLDDNQLAAVRHWQGPTLNLDTGLITIGSFADAQPAHFRLYRPYSGAVNALISGCPDSGKTALLNLLLAETALSKLCAAWLLDPQNGQSLPDWTGKVDLTAVGAEACVWALRVAKKIMMDRSGLLGRLEWIDDQGRKRIGQPYFHPTPTFPLLILVIDEAHELTKHHEYGDEVRQLLGDIAKMGRKTGLGVELVTQLPSLEELGSQTVRSMLTGGNAVCLRTGDKVSAAMIGIDADPFALPMVFPDGSTTAGLGYTRGPDGRPNATMRTDLVADPYGVATSTPMVILDDRARIAGADLGYHGRGQIVRSDDTDDGAILTAESPPPTTPSSGPSGAVDTATVDAVDQALHAAGQPLPIGEIVHHTNSTLGHVKAALAVLADQGRATQTTDGWRNDAPQSPIPTQDRKERR